MRYAVLFPGQGAQFVGMGAELFDVRPDLLGETADAVLGWSLAALCGTGPEESLTRTEHAQPALYALAHALWDEFAKAAPFSPVAAAGHSLGEYTALASSGAMTYEEGLALVAARGTAMAAAADAEPSGMAALLGADVDAAEALAESARRNGGRLWVANVNAPGQVVVAGAMSEIEWAVEHGREFSVRRVIPLNVAGAFHTPFMESAVPALEQAVGSVSFARPEFEVWGNTAAVPLAQEDIAGALVRQIVEPVRFALSLERMAAAGVEAFVHVGPGDVTAGMARRTIPDAQIFVVGDLAAIGPVTEALAG